MEAGYVWDEKARQGLTANIRKPKKDGFYDHGQNCLEYGVLAFGPSNVSEKEEARLERLAVARSQRDSDPNDRRILRPVMRRGGY